MNVACHRVDAHVAVAVARADRRNLEVERHPGFGDKRLPTQCLPGRIDVVAGADDELTLAVITEAPRLDDDREPQRIDGCRDVVARVDRAVAGDRDADALEQASRSCEWRSASAGG